MGSKPIGPKEAGIAAMRNARFASAKVPSKPIAALKEAVAKIPVKRGPKTNRGKAKV